jgi:hypothetical protein
MNVTISGVWIGIGLDASDNARRTISFFMLAAPLSIIRYDAFAMMLCDMYYFNILDNLICAKHGNASRKGLESFFIGASGRHKS